LIRKCPNNTGTGNQVINNEFVGHIEYNKEKETKIDFSATTNLVPYEVPIKKEDLDKYVRLPKEIIGDWDKAAFDPKEYKDCQEGPPGTNFGFWHHYKCCESDERSKEMDGPNKTIMAKTTTSHTTVTVLQGTSLVLPVVEHQGLIILG
jgi:hypothetical protein